MTSLVVKVGSVVPIEPGERLLAAAYVPAIGRRGQARRRHRATTSPTSGPTMGPAVVAVSDRRFLFAPRSAFMSSSSWRDRRLDEVRVEVSRRRSLGFVVAYGFEVIDGDGSPVTFELEQRKDAEVFRKAFARRLVPREPGR
jgi:hypothetical protein